MVKEMKIKSAVMLSLAAVAMSLAAMPTQQELKQAERLVYALMRPQLDAFKAGKATRADVAKSAAALAEKAESDAAKMLLLRGSFTLYVGHGAFDEAIGVLKTLKAAIPDIPPENMANMIESALRNMPKSDGGSIYRLLDDTKSYVRHRDELEKALAESKKRPNDKTLHLRIAELYASLGDWPKALDEFAKGDNPEAAEAAKAEKGGGKMPKIAIADFWWSYPANGEEGRQKTFKRHAAAIYAEAIESGDAGGLVKVKAQRRIDEVKENGEDMLAGVITGPAGEAAGNSRPSAGNLYCVVDISAGPNAASYPVSYLAAEPKGGWTDEYKMTKLVLRRVEPGKFMMCGKCEVTLTKPYYIGVFEVTQKQYERVTGGRIADDMRSMELSYNQIRGSSQIIKDWTFMAKLRLKTKLDFDLPTEAQWEYACRAEKASDCDKEKKDVKDLDACGIYGMEDNAWEWCLDYFGPVTGGVDPMGSSSGWRRVVRLNRNVRNLHSPIYYRKGLCFRIALTLQD